MNCPDRRISEYLDRPDSPRKSTARVIRGGRIPGLISFITGAVLLGTSGIAHSGPCTEQIAQVDALVSTAAPGPESGPTGPQTLGAQLHFQPTPADVAHAERAANKDAAAALARARKADAAGDAAECKAALSEAKRLYDIDQ